MILLDLSNPFTFKLRDQFENEKEIKGTFREYTKEEQIKAKEKHEKAIKRGEEAQKITREIARNAKQIEVKENIKDYEAVDKLFTRNVTLEAKLEKLSKEVNKDSLDDGLVERFALCLGGDQKDEIIALAEQVGYQTVYAKISEAITAGKSKD